MSVTINGSGEITGVIGIKNVPASDVTYDGGTVQDVLDDAKPMQSYTALRAYTGRATGVRITTPGIAGFFQRLGTIGLTDNGGTIIVDALGRAWERLYSSFVHVNWFGAVGNNSTDDAASINAADVYAKSAGKCLQFEGKPYLIKSPITMSAPWIAVANSTTIRIPSDFVYPTELSAPRKYSAVVNKNCASTYNPATADGVYMSGFTFIDEGGASGFDTVAFGNVKAGCMTDCVFTTNTSTTKTPLDLFACVKNFTIERSRAYNNTQAGSGGCMWVRNITSDGSIEANNTENIYVYACYFEQTAGDEAFAVYGVNGVSRNVKVVNCTFKGIASSQPHGSLVTAFPLGATANAAVQDVLFSNCRFESSNFTNDIFRAGQTADASRVCKDIRVENSYFKASLPVAGTSAVARNIPGVGGNVTFVNNIIDAEGSANTITYGAQSFDSAFDSTVSGLITYGFYLCSNVDACIIKATVSTGAYNCGQVTNCDITSAGTAVLATTTGKYIVSNNKLTLTGTTGNPYGVFFNTISGSAPYGEITGNKISMNYSNAVAIRNAGTGVTNTRVNNNRVDGVGKSIQGSQFLEVQGNSWFGVLDSMRTAGYLDYDHNLATPIGTFANAATHTVGTSRYLLGFIKTANAGVGADWKSVYVENANN